MPEGFARLYTTHRGFREISCYDVPGFGLPRKTKVPKTRGAPGIQGDRFPAALVSVEKGGPSSTLNPKP